jgi:hypothetical protein
MSVWIKVVVCLGVFALLAAAAALAHFGAFRKVSIQEADEGPFVFVYQTSAGHDPAAVGKITTALNASLRAAGITERKPFDFYSVPGTGPNEIGFIIPSEARVERVLDGKTLSRIIPRQRYMVTSFPFKGRLSFVVGYLKVDPALAGYRASHGYPVAPAIARNDGDTITYLQPVGTAKTP